MLYNTHRKMTDEQYESFNKFLTERIFNSWGGCISERPCNNCKTIFSDSPCFCIGTFTCPECGHENGTKWDSLKVDDGVVNWNFPKVPSYYDELRYNG